MSKDYYIRVGDYDFNLANIVTVKNIVNDTFRPPMKAAQVSLVGGLEVYIPPTDFQDWERIWSRYMKEITRRYERESALEMSDLPALDTKQVKDGDTWKIEKEEIERFKRAQEQ